jgi:hypothetical protein
MTGTPHSTNGAALRWTTLVGGLLLVGLAGSPVRAQLADTAGVKAAVRAAVLRSSAGKGLVEVDSAGADSLLFRCLRVETAASTACRANPLPRMLVISQVRVRGGEGDALAAVYSPKATRDGLDITEIEVRVTRQGSTWLAHIQRVTVSEEFIDPDEK